MHRENKELFLNVCFLCVCVCTRMHEGAHSQESRHPANVGHQPARARIIVRGQREPAGLLHTYTQAHTPFLAPGSSPPVVTPAV